MLIEVSPRSRADKEPTGPSRDCAPSCWRECSVWESHRAWRLRVVTPGKGRGSQRWPGLSILQVAMACARGLGSDCLWLFATGAASVRRFGARVSRLTAMERSRPPGCARLNFRSKEDGAAVVAERSLLCVGIAPDFRIISWIHKESARRLPVAAPYLRRGERRAAQGLSFKGSPVITVRLQRTEVRSSGTA